MRNLILVTGGTGYIGSHTVVELMNEGFDVVIIDNLSNSEKYVLNRITKITGRKPYFEQFDLCNKKKLDNFFKKYLNINAVIHFASKKSVSESIKCPLIYYQNNLISLTNILKSMDDYKIHYMVFSSSCVIYGNPDKLPVTENSPIKFATSPYNNTKQISEEIISDTIKPNHNLNVISLRYFNPIGAHQSSLIGELPLNIPDNLIPYITQTAYGLRDYLKVFGNDYNTPDGFAIRDYINVVDLAKAHVVSIKRLLEKTNKNNFEVFNLGTGKGSSVMDVINLFQNVTGIKLNYKIIGRRDGDIESIYANIDLAEKELRWKSNTSLSDSLLSAWRWEKSFRAIKK